MRRATPLSRLRNALPRGRPDARDERGFTLVELAVATLIMSIFTALIMAGMIHLVTPTLQTEAIRDSSDQLNIAFLDLDSTVRYASEIWAPYAGTPASDDTWDLLFESSYNGAAEPTCNELQYNYSNGELLLASWSQGAGSANFKALATNLTGNSDPFQVVSNPAYEEVQLTVTLAAVAGSSTARETTTSSVTFTALNSTSNAAATGTACNAAWTTS